MPLHVISHATFLHMQSLSSTLSLFMLFLSAFLSTCFLTLFLSFFPSLFPFHFLLSISSHVRSFSHIFILFLAASHTFSQHCAFSCKCMAFHAALHPNSLTSFLAVSRSVGLTISFLLSQAHSISSISCLTLYLSTSLSHELSHFLFLAHSFHPFLACSSPHSLSPVLPFFYTLVLSCVLPFSNALTFPCASLFLHLRFLTYSCALHPFPYFLLCPLFPPPSHSVYCSLFKALPLVFSRLSAIVSSLSFSLFLSCASFLVHVCVLGLLPSCHFSRLCNIS